MSEHISIPAAQQVERATVFATIRRWQPDGSYIEEDEEVAAFYSIHPEEMKAWNKELRRRQGVPENFILRGLHRLKHLFSKG